MSSMTPDAAKRLGDAVRARRKELRWKRDRIHANGGPSTTTQLKIERGQISDPPNGTLEKLDAGLDWMDGSAARIFYDGGEPTPKPRAGQKLGDALLLATDLGPLGRLVKIRDQLDLVIADLRREHPPE